MRSVVVGHAGLERVLCVCVLCESVYLYVRESAVCMSVACVYLYVRVYVCINS